MLKRSRVSGVLDVSRLGQALARPGMDTRTWVTFAYALGESVVEGDGMFVDLLLSTGQQLTAQVSPEYAGPGFGLYSKVHKDDEVVVLIPDGDPNHGGIVVSRPWSAATPPPDSAVSNPDDYVLVVEKDKHLRLETSGSGKAYVKSESKVVVDSPEVDLGGEDATEQLVMGTTYRGQQSSLDTVLLASWQAIFPLMTTISGFMAIPIVGPMLSSPAFATLSTLYENMAVAVQQFEALSAQYLSNVSKTK